MATSYKEFKLDAKKVAELKEDILTTQNPLGGHTFEYADGHFNSELYQILFNWHPDQFHEDHGIRPSIILGRRGSGKSSYLNNLSQKEQVIAVPVKSWDAVDLVEERIREILKDQSTIDPEKTAEIWQLIFLTLATNAAIREGVVVDSFRQMLKNFPIGELGAMSAVKLAAEVITLFKKKYLEGRTNTKNISLVIDAMNLGFDSLSEWEDLLSHSVRSEGKYLILMIDNPERLDTTMEDKFKSWQASYSEASEARWHAYAGLLRLLAHFNKSKPGVQVRYCVAAEQYFFLQDRSSAILKDFSDIQLLHWSSGDLLSSLAHRYMVYLQFNPDHRDEDKYRELLKLEIYTREGARAFFDKLFEGEIVNGRGLTEKPVRYLLRHTQLLPRQVLMYMNSVMRNSLTRDSKAKLTSLDAGILKEAVEENEELLATEIVDSFRSEFPEGKELLRRIKNLPILGSYEDYEAEWMDYEIAGVLDDYSHFPQVSKSSNRLMDLLTEAGILGKATGETNSNGYINAEFEYTVPQRLHTDPDNLMVVHPIFSKYTKKDTHTKLDGSLGVYPKGTSLEEIQDKMAMRKKYIR